MCKKERLTCRTCLGMNYMVYIDIFEHCEEDKLLSEILMEFTELKVEKQDELSRYMCQHCVDKLISAQEFKLMAVDSAINFKDDHAVGLMPLSVKQIRENIEESQPAEVAIVKKELTCEESRLSCEERKVELMASNIEMKIDNDTANLDANDSVFNEKDGSSMKHTDERSYRCNICQKGYKMKPVLKQHLRLHDFDSVGAFRDYKTTHMTDKTCTCPICNKTFSRLKHLKRHQQLTHTDNKPYACSNCDKKLKVASVLKRHDLIHTREKAYSCNICQKSFRQREYLAAHIRSHTGETPYVSEQSLAKFKLLRLLRKHRSTHNN